MARATKLKVYRTVAGFHDAYVAAPSQKAALRAWGSDRDLFARGIAEQVTDPALTAEPLAAPGTVVKRSRGTSAEQIAALPDPQPDTPERDASTGKARAKPPSPGSAGAKSKAPAKPPPRAKPDPKPSGTALDAAEETLAAVKADYAGRERALAAREAALTRERRVFDRDRAAALDAAQTARDDAQARYDAALRTWRAARG
ncbi:hypothetical protein [Sphingomonas sp. Leaf20]|uniref:hypothetical protein n=1 Tax=Sphingomonas sp. Leaf20 TaxID=1735685 RepID=UPI000700BF3C|nr:hypothetical protein [Sphingomonas sp. Leaf20]KQM71761.1 hypothetical protein ASE72_09585 [Sphingomonas sp. Leaf20]